MDLIAPDRLGKGFVHQPLRDLCRNSRAKDLSYYLARGLAGTVATHAGSATDLGVGFVDFLLNPRSLDLDVQLEQHRAEPLYLDLHVGRR